LKLGRSRQQRGEFEGAIDIYQSALEHDDLQESVHQRLIDCYRVTGRRAEGLRAYERCRRRLRQALHVAPSEETEALKAQLLKAS
jgi:DNA-binding SARP family transcriptional activator